MIMTPCTSMAFPHIIYHVKDSTLDPRAKKFIFLGFDSSVKGYRLWCPKLKKIIHSHDVMNMNILSCLPSRWRLVYSRVVCSK